MTDNMRSPTSNNGITDYKSAFICMFEMRFANISNSINCDRPFHLIKGFNRYSSPLSLISYIVDNSIPSLPFGKPC